MINVHEKGAKRRRLVLAAALVVLLALLLMPVPAFAEEVEGGAETVVSETAPAGSAEAEPAEGAQPEAKAPAAAGEPAAAESRAVEVPAENGEAPDAELMDPPPDTKPYISLSKTGPDEGYPGQLVTYTLKVTNTGAVTLSNVTMYDDQIDFYFAVGTLAPGASVTKYPMYNIPLNAAGVFPNNAGATGFGPTGQQAVDNDNWRIRIIEPPPPGISVVKGGPAQACVGAEITYTYYVSNTGGYPLSSVELTDDKFGPIASWASLAMGTSTSATKKVTVGEDWANPYVNVATVNASVGGNNLSVNSIPAYVSDTDNHSLVVLHPAITVDKTVEPATAAVGDTVTYSFLVTNTGDTQLTNIDVVDDKLGDIALDQALAPGGSQNYTKDYTVVQADLPEIVNVVTVTADTPCQTQVGDTDTVTLPVTGAVPVGAMTVTKALTTGGTVTVGDQVTFSITIANTGQTDILAPVAVVDTYDAAALGFVSASIAPTSAGGGVITWADLTGGATLAMGESVSVSVTFQALAAGTTTNSVTATATDSMRTPLTGSSADSVTINAAEIPEIPVIPEIPEIPEILPPSIVGTPAAAPRGVLPRTGADFTGFLATALVLIPLGLLALTAGAIRRRKRA